jgi:hypothetical protein
MEPPRRRKTRYWKATQETASERKKSIAGNGQRWQNCHGLFDGGAERIRSGDLSGSRWNESSDGFQPRALRSVEPA